MKCLCLPLFAAALLTIPTDSMFAQARPGAPAASNSRSDTAFAELEGAWVAEKILSAGQTVPGEKFPYEYHFKRPNQLIRKGITVGKVTGRDRQDEVTLDGSQKPAAMNITWSNRGKPQTVLAIYKIEGDLLTMCFFRGPQGEPSLERPAVFESKAETKSDLLVLKRKREP